MSLDVGIQNRLDQFKNRFIYSRYRFHLRKLVAPFFFSFSVLDYWYSPENIVTWSILRFIFFVTVWLLFIPIARYRQHRQNIQLYVAAITVLACNIVNIMIYQSGGYESKYFIGVILCAVAGIQLFKLDKIYSFFVQVLAYVPSIIILLATAPKSDFKSASIQSLFFIAMAILSYIFGASDEDNTIMLIKMKQKMKQEIDRLNRTESLKKYFPTVVRKELELNPDLIGKNKKVYDVVVGFADISNSTQISNSIELERDWTLKEKFLEAATSHALKNDLVVLTHLGDGFLFLVNYVNQDVWQENLLIFYQNLVREYEKIYATTVGLSGSIKSGVKFGLAKGDVIIGFLGSDQAYFTAIGSTVNLASRVCSKAESNELVVPDYLWKEMSAFIGNLTFKRIENSELKGFQNKWELVKISPLTKKRNALVSLCADCQKEMDLVESPDGLLDYVCRSCELAKAKGNIEV